MSVLYLNALFDPEVPSHGLPVLWAHNVEQTVVDALLYAAVKHVNKLLADPRLLAAQSCQEGGLQLRRQLTATQGLVPGT